MSKFQDIVSAATGKSAALQNQIDSLTAQKSALDKLVAEAANLSPETVSLIDAISADVEQIVQPQDTDINGVQ